MQRQPVAGPVCGAAASAGWRGVRLSRTNLAHPPASASTINISSRLNQTCKFYHRRYFTLKQETTGTFD